MSLTLNPTQATILTWFWLGIDNQTLLLAKLQRKAILKCFVETCIDCQWLGALKFEHFLSNVIWKLSPSVFLINQQVTLEDLFIITSSQFSVSFSLLCQWGQSHTSQLQFTSNSKISVNQRFAVLKMKFNYTKNRFKLTSLDTHIPFFRAISTTLWLSGERLFWMLHHNIASNSARWQNSLQPLGHFVWHWNFEWTDTSFFYVAVLSIIFPHEPCQWLEWF